MFHHQMHLTVVELVGAASLILAACASSSPAPTLDNATSVIVPSSTAAATATPTWIVEYEPPTFRQFIPGDPGTLDPSIDYDIGTFINGQIYETLLTYDGAHIDRFRSLLAESIPEPTALKNGGSQYVWTIKGGIQFANGDPLTAEDVAYSLWRTLLIGDPNTPAWLLNEAFFDVDDVTQISLAPDGQLAGDRDALRQADPQRLRETCERVKSAIQFDNASRTVTMTLVHAWAPLFASIAAPWAAAQDKAWVAAQGDWDGDCATWQNFYGLPPEQGKLQSKTNGTGPYQLDKWTPGEELVLIANPRWHGGSVALKRVVLKPAPPELGTQIAMLQAGDVDAISIISAADWLHLDPLVRETCSVGTGDCQTTNPNGLLRVYQPILQTSSDFVLFNFAIAANSPYIGSGRLDGDGVPPDFFTDLHVRRAFNYCFDWDTFITDAAHGDATQARALTLPGMPGYEGSPAYHFDLKQCEVEFKAATLKNDKGQSIWETGFYLQVPYYQDNNIGQLVTAILAADLARLNSKFLVVGKALPLPALQQANQAGQSPLVMARWFEDIHDPHNWYQPYLQGFFAHVANLPDALRVRYASLIDQGVHETDPARRAVIYRQLNQLVFDDTPMIMLANQTGRVYMPVYVRGAEGGLSLNPMTGTYFAELSKQ